MHKYNLYRMKGSMGERANDGKYVITYIIIINPNMSSNSILLSILVFLFLLKTKELKQRDKFPYHTVLNEDFKATGQLGRSSPTLTPF